MKRLLLLVLVLVLVLGTFGCRQVDFPEVPESTATVEPTKTAGPDLSEAITSVDAELVTKIPGIHEVRRDPSLGAVGDKNFADNDDRLVFIVAFGDRKWFEKLKASGAFREEVDGLGDEAFVGPNKETRDFVYQVVVRKGNNAFLVGSNFAQGGKSARVPQPQLEELARRILEHL